jgi:hypothetical protein
VIARQLNLAEAPPRVPKPLRDRVGDVAVRAGSVEPQYGPELEVELAPGQGASLICEPTIFPPLGPGWSISLQRIR